MFNIIEKRRWFFLFSAFLIVPGLIVMTYSTITTGSPFRLSIDFVGGTIYDLTYTAPGATEEGIREVFNKFGIQDVSIQKLTSTSTE
ncbi:MAG TPA: hypothetical protein VHL11_19445, partial [Phototrophicaceae bacterium]|nr:hypothetical protein [Phototrophicaceae bacterium]